MELQLRNGNVLKYDGAQVMGIINVTPDSFFSGSRCSGEANIRARVSEIIEEGGTMVDVGAYSTRPDADEVSAVCRRLCLSSSASLRLSDAVM